jgi:hypothetical protein
MRGTHPGFPLIHDTSPLSSDRRLAPRRGCGGMNPSHRATSAVVGNPQIKRMLLVVGERRHTYNPG